MEAHFAGIGAQLFARLEDLNGLVAASSDLTAELDSPEVRAAVEALQAVPPAIEALGRDGGARGQVLRRLLQLVDHVISRVDGAQSALRPVSIIAMNAKVEAARVGEESLHFKDFAEEIGAAFRQAKDSLESVFQDMQSLRARVQAASAQEEELDARLGEAVHGASTRILASLDALAARSAAAGTAAARIREETRVVASGVSDAVLSLQVGDCARQRLEHVSFALDLMAQLEAHGSLAPVDDAAVVSPLALQGLARLCCDLQRAQVLDTSRELFDDVESTVAALRQLAASAEQISKIGEGLFAAEDEDSSFLAVLDRAIRQAQALFRHLEAAWFAADDIVESVLQTVNELEIRVASVTAAEREVRRLALNAIVKAGRLGEHGRALGVIAQQLEACVELTTEQTSHVVTRLSELVDLSQELRQSSGQAARASVGEAAGSTEEALSRLSAMAARVSGGLGRLSAESSAIARAVAATARETDFHHRWASTAAACATDLGELVGDLAAADCPPEIAEPVFARMARTYTMVRERDIHAEVLAPAGLFQAAG